MNLFNGKIIWGLIDCIAGEKKTIPRMPFEIGSGEAADLRLGSDEVYERHCGLITSHKKYLLVKWHPQADVILDGAGFEHAVELVPKTDFSLRIGSQLYLLRGEPTISGWFDRINPNEWILQNHTTRNTWNPVPFDQLRQLVDQTGVAAGDLVAALVGAQKGFFVDEIIDLLPRPVSFPPPVPVPAKVPAQQTTPAPAPAFPDPVRPPNEDKDIDEISGEFTCPTCWLHFDREDLLWIACHKDLRGADPDLGEDHMLRFQATVFNERGQAIDPMGVACTEQACPHCKRRLPPGFLDLKNHIFSIVGAPASGKSYFLSSAIFRLERTLPKQFGAAFHDADADGNSLVSVMKAKLFSTASKPEDIYLDKTQVGGEMFELWERSGRKVRLPKPFAFTISDFEKRKDGTSPKPVNLIFYDNAGEQFLPVDSNETRNADDRETTRHLSSSAVIFFLFDPTTNPDFRAKLADTHGVDDPQLTDSRFTKLDRQNSILANMGIRVKSDLNINSGERIKTPIAMLVGKCDIWSRLLGRGDNPFVNPIHDRHLDLDEVEENSTIIRDFLMEMAPNVVAIAEALSREVVFFPVSPLGHSPQPFTVVRTGSDGKVREETLIGPVPGKVNPLHTEVPIIWALHRVQCEMVPA